MSTTASKKPKQSGKCKMNADEQATIHECIEAMRKHLDKDYQFHCSIYSLGMSEGALIESARFCGVFGVMILFTLISTLIAALGGAKVFTIVLAILSLAMIIIINKLVERTKRRTREKEYKRLEKIRDIQLELLEDKDE